MNYHIRELQNEDIERVAYLYKEMYKEQIEMGMVFDFNNEYIIDLLKIKVKSKFHISLVIENNDEEIIGMVITSLAKIPNKYRLEGQKLIGFIEDLYITKEYRTNDYGKKLFYEVERVFKEKDIKYLELDVLNQNEVGKRFWESLGFKNVTQTMYKSI